MKTTAIFCKQKQEIFERNENSIVIFKYAEFGELLGIFNFSPAQKEQRKVHE